MNRNPFEVKFVSIAGTPAEIGVALAAHFPQHAVIEPNRPMPLSRHDLLAGTETLAQYCPSLLDELNAYAQALSVDPLSLFYHQLTYLKPHCSQLYVPARFTENGHGILARNYEFAPAAEDFAVVSLKPAGRYAHISGTIALFGRSEGINEHGLAISMTSCGYPVGNMPGMQSAKHPGLQFWAVIRELLETCASADEALQKVHTMPLAYNINLLIADSHGKAVLYETLDGESAFVNANDQYLYATNHAVLDPFRQRLPYAMRNSVQRYNCIQDFLPSSNSCQTSSPEPVQDAKMPKIAVDAIKSLLLSPYPDGLSCPYYEDYFGTIKSVIMDLQTRSYQICWGGNPQNDWQEYGFEQPAANASKEITIFSKPAERHFFEQIPY